jgi:hypothetical protein
VFQGEGTGHIQSVIIAAVLFIAGFQIILIGLLADLIAVNRRLSEDILLRVKRLEMGDERQGSGNRGQESGDRSRETGGP